MPLVRISLKVGRSSAEKSAIADQVYEAMRETFNVPDEDRFILLHEHDAAQMSFSRTYFGVNRSDDTIFLQLTVGETRSVQQKKALFRRVVERLRENPGVRPEDVFINLVETKMENWSFGNGIAQHVVQKEAWRLGL